MDRIFNVTADCRPDQHYMVDLSGRLAEIKGMVDRGEYFTVNRARQYGKTTVLKALAKLLREEYEVISLDFQLLSYENFESERAFVKAFSGELLDNAESMPDGIREGLILFSEGKTEDMTLSALFKWLSKWCGGLEKKAVLIIDEVDSAANNQVFLDFLAQLRGYYIRRDKKPAFQSVILAGVYDVKNIRRKLRPEEEHKRNSPWNIAAEFLVDMAFSEEDIAGMLRDYENDWCTGMDIAGMAKLLYVYTSGYPFLVSRLCKLMDERISDSMSVRQRTLLQGKKASWTKEGLLEAVRVLLNEKNTLFESLINKVSDYPELRILLYELLFTGKSIPYNPLERSIEMAEMFGFIRNAAGNIAVANRIFESLLYNFFLSEELVTSKVYDAGLQERYVYMMEWEKNVRKVEPYVPGEQPESTDVIKLNTNECPYPPAPGVRKLAEEFDYGRLRLYPDTEAGKLSDALCGYYGISPEQLFIGVGSDDVLAMAFQAFFNSDRPVLFPDITYSFYDVWAELFRIPYVQKALDADFRIVKEDYMGENGGIVIPNPNAPTGIFEPVGLMEEIIAANPGSVVIVDEAYVDFGGESCLKLTEKYDNLLVVQTFSKSRAMAGLRIGFAIGNPKLIGYLKDVKFSFNSYTMNMPSIEFGAEAVRDAEYFKDTVNKIIHTRERMKRELSGLGFSFPDSMANFIFVSHEKAPAKALFEELKKRKIFVRFWDKPRISNYLRITVGTDSQMDILVQNLREILAGL